MLSHVDRGGSAPRRVARASQGRGTQQDVEHHGHQVPAGSAIVLLNGSGNRNVCKFAHGDRFDMTRRIDHHLAFDYGLHFYLGAALARSGVG
jgi:cytochrome P450